MKEEQIKRILKEKAKEEFKRVYEGDFLTRDVYFCLEDEDRNKFMIIVKNTD
jgi:hypothetical protein